LNFPNKGEYEGELKKLLDFLFHNDKGQLISKDFFLVSRYSKKNQRNFLQISALASKKWLKQKLKSLDVTN
jgi:hypothetical protein